MLLFHMILFILMKVTVTKNNAGTAIFYNKVIKGDCWNNDDIVKLQARKAFEGLVPPQVTPDKVDANYIKHVLRYFQRALHSMDNVAEPHTLTLLKEAVSDTIGAHLRSDILPAVRFSYYAGYIPYKNAREIHDFYDEIKAYLNTQGLGWRKPRKTQKWSNLTVAKILIGAGTFFNPCACLITKRDSNNCIHLPAPKQDNDEEPSAIVLPFKTNGLVSLNSPDSTNALLQYYTTASRCILSRSPEKCRHSDFISFNNELWHWMKRDVAPHLIDEKLYTAYGGILRIAASVQNYGKGLSRRNLFEDKDSGISTWHPWRAFAQSYVYVNADWTPQVYVGLVVMTAISIYILQMCYGYVFGDSSGCNCKGHSGFSFFTRNTNARMENLSTLVPHQSAMYYKVRKKLLNSKSASLGSIQKQKVYDLNENTEKMMEVIMSSDDESEVEMTTSQSSSEVDENVETIRAKSRSPPRLETSISELTVARKSRSKMPYTSSTQTGKNRNSPKESESQSSGSETSCTSRSGSSTSKTKSGSSRDLEWARRVISRHSSRTTTRTTTKTLSGKDQEATTGRSRTPNNSR